MGLDISNDKFKTFNIMRGVTSSTSSREDDITSYGFYLGGTDVTSEALKQYDLARGGYGRLFIMKMPTFMDCILPSATAKVKHLLQFANVGIDGIQGYTVDFASLTAGYSGTNIEIPTGSKDDTTGLSIKLYETSSYLIRSYIDTWITGVIDPYTGLAHYHGAMDVSETPCPYQSQSYQTMEAIYVATDPTGTKATYACLLANMFPRSSDHSMFSYSPGDHQLMEISLEFTANKYMSPQITGVAQQLLDNFGILRNYLNFKSGYSKDDSDKEWSKQNHTAPRIWNPTKGTDRTVSYHNSGTASNNVTGEHPISK